MKILLLADDLWHPGEAVRFGLQFLADRGDQLDWIMDAKDIVTPELLRTYDAVIIAKGNALNAANSQAPWFEDGITWVDPNGYKKFVEEGGAILVLHAGMTFHPDRCPDMAAFLGTKMNGHPPQCPVDFKVTNSAHPIMKGISDFTFPQDEHYRIEVLCDDADIFCETISAEGTFPAGMTRVIGDGRLCLLSPGHNAFAINVPEYQKVICNALDWITKKI